MTPSLNSFILSLVAGAFIVLAIAVAVIWVSSNDRLTRSS